jgi:hypothetical protein
MSLSCRHVSRTAHPSTYLPIENGPTTTSFAGGFKTLRAMAHCGTLRAYSVQVTLQARSGSPSVTSSAVTSAKVPHLCWISEAVFGHGLKWLSQ